MTNPNSSIDWKKYQRLLKFLSDTGMTVDEAQVFLEKRVWEDGVKNPPSEYDVMTYEQLVVECKRRGLI